MTNNDVGIDLGMKTLVTLSTSLKITNAGLTYVESIIKKYQKQMSRREPECNRYHKSQKKILEMCQQEKHHNKRCMPQIHSFY